MAMVVEIPPRPLVRHPEAVRDLGAWAVRLLVVAMLAYDAYVHASLAEQRWSGGPLFTESQLFAAEATGAAVVAAALLLSGRRAVWAAAAVVALGGLFAVVVTRYVDVPAFGPIPSMYEPIWYGEKTLSAIAEGIGGLVAAVRVVQLRGSRW